MEPPEVVVIDEPSPESDNFENIKPRLEAVLQVISDAHDRSEEDRDITLVAVSKLKPIHFILEAYNLGQRDFGENYVIELQMKSNQINVTSLCPDIRWHFIGHVQTNKVKKLVVACPNLYMVHTIDSVKLADAFNKAWEIMLTSEPLKILIQVNTSREENKSGVQVEDAEMLVNHVITKCPQLDLKGLMTIGSFDHDLESGPNPDFLTLIKLRDTLEKKFNIPLELSMGMSNDFEHAIELGSTYVRVGEKIFGPRSKTASTTQ